MMILNRGYVQTCKHVHLYL